MIYVIMCGGKYPHFSEHKALTKINGEPLIQRTVRLLKSVTDYKVIVESHSNKYIQIPVYDISILTKGDAND